MRLPYTTLLFACEMKAPEFEEILASELGGEFRKSILEACLWSEQLPKRAMEHLVPTKITAAKTNKQKKKIEMMLT